MHRRLLAIALLLVAILQGSALSYGATLATNDDSTGRACGSHMLDEKNCDTCCAHGSTPSCAAQCPVPVSAAVPLSLALSIRVAMRGVIIPDAGIAPFHEFDPPHPLRPPIV